MDIFRIQNSLPDFDNFPRNFTIKVKTNGQFLEIAFKKKTIEAKEYPDIYVLDKNGNPVRYNLQKSEVKHLKN